MRTSDQHLDDEDWAATRRPIIAIDASDFDGELPVHRVTYEVYP